MAPRSSEANGIWEELFGGAGQGVKDFRAKRVEGPDPATGPSPAKALGWSLSDAEIDAAVEHDRAILKEMGTDFDY